MVAPDAEEITEMEDAAQAARFREVKAKLATDAAAMVSFNAQVATSEKRSHVVTVMHERAQVQTGRECLDVCFATSF